MPAGSTPFMPLLGALIFRPLVIGLAVPAVMVGIAWLTK